MRWAPRARGELNPLETMISRGKPLRGNAAKETFDGETPGPPPGTVPHRRGYLGQIMVGPLRDDERRERRRWQPRWISPITAIDLSSAMEGEAAVELHDTDLILGRRLLKQSRRDKKNLKPGGERRSKMERRVRKAQAQYDRQRRREEGWYTKVRAAARLRKDLEAMGVDVDSVFASIAATPAEASIDSPAIAEAIRRGDLPPDADPMPQPSSRELLVRIFHGPHTGKTGQISVGYIAPAMVLRLGGGAERVPRTLKVQFDDGEFDLYHPDDVVPVADLD